jgi:hypothetical protein
MPTSVEVEAEESPPPGLSRWDIMTKRILSGIVALLAPLAVTVVLASPAGAATVVNTIGDHVSFDPADEVAWTCSDGSQVGLGFDITRNIHEYYDADGNLTLLRRNVNFTGIFQNMSTGEQYTFQGTRIVTLDFVKGTFMGSGNYRTVTMPHAGVVLQSAGVSIESLDVEGLIYQSGGPRYDEWAAGSAAVCSLFGLQGA